VTRAEIPSNGKIEGHYLAQVIEQVEIPATSKDSRLRLRDINDEECWLDIWRTHEINDTFEKGAWYRFTGLIGQIFDQGGTKLYKLNSTSNMAVSPPEETIDVNALRSHSSPSKSAFGASDSDTSTAENKSSHSDAPTPRSDDDDTSPSNETPDSTNHDEDGIIGDILGEFDND
jgi:hypothetical protein